MEHGEGRTNRLAKETSPYLLMHSRNPVDWYPWGEDAIRKAKNDGKPVFLSIGYSTCHWCHVMERESFEDEGTAALLNKNFISIKVDREERPEVDAYYMGAVQAMTGGGGWPLNVFLTPDLKPFYGGTYWPPVARDGMPSFSQVVEFVAKVWKERRGEAVAGADQIAAALASRSSETTGLKTEQLDDGYRSLVSSFDSDRGGFGAAPKFPLPLASLFLLRYHFRTGSSLALSAVTKTLDAMASGGIRDHIGGGFHRYSTDREWLVPHFEKMLYDNALLLRLYSEAYQLTRDEAYSEVAKEVAAWMTREMQSDPGGFLSAQDADTSAGEGNFYTWTPQEVAAVLGEGPSREFCERYGVTANGNFDGRSILHTRGRAEPEPKDWKSELYRARSLREKPETDAKVLTAWNGLAISGMAVAATALGEPAYADAASRAASFVVETLSRSGKLLRVYAGGAASLDGTLEDHAFLASGLLDLFEATSETRWLREAEKLGEAMIGEFEDKEDGGFYLTVGEIPPRMKESYDGPVPSGNSFAAVSLLKLAEYTGKESFAKSAKRTLECFSKELESSPAAHANMLMALDLHLNGMREVVVTGRTQEATAKMKRAMWGVYAPDKVSVVATAKTYSALSAVSPLLEGRRPGAGPVAYVCEGRACRVPAKSPAELISQLRRETG